MTLTTTWQEIAAIEKGALIQASAISVDVRVTYSPAAPAVDAVTVTLGASKLDDPVFLPASAENAIYAKIGSGTAELKIVEV